jgi:hypothetical protein
MVTTIEIPIDLLVDVLIAGFKLGFIALVLAGLGAIVVRSVREALG